MHIQQETSTRAAGIAGGTSETCHHQHIAELFLVHEPYLRRLAIRLCRSAMEPDDLLQDVLERAMQHYDSLIASGDPRAWMARVMRNLFIDRWRKAITSPWPAALDEEPVAPVSEAPAWWEELDADDIRARLAELPADLRSPFELFTFEGCSYAEIAERLQIAKNTVGSRVLRARRRLRQVFVSCYGAGATSRRNLSRTACARGNRGASTSARSA